MKGNRVMEERKVIICECFEKGVKGLEGKQRLMEEGKVIDIK